MCIDYVARLEQIHDDYPEICAKLGVAAAKFPKVNSRFHFSYTRQYDDTLRRRVADYYAEDIETFGYRFGD